MYESPIKIIQAEIDMQMEGEILKAVQRFGVDVDKKELLKALEYDRDSYKKGYEDGRNENRWIQCSERLPVEDGEYLCQWKFNGQYVMDILCFSNDLFEVDEFDFYEYKGMKKKAFYGCDSEFGYFEHNNIIAWMPLPEPYKGE